MDKKKTHNAWEGKDNGIDVLSDLFGITPALLWVIGDKHTGRPLPFRRKPGVPNMRPDADARKRRARRKQAHESRRRNYANNR